MNQPRIRYEVLRAHMHDMATDPAMQKAQSVIEADLRRWAKERGVETMALLNCAIRDVSLDQALTLANVTIQKSDTLLAPMNDHLVSLVKSLVHLTIPVNQGNPD